MANIFHKIEKKWQAKWEKNPNLWRANNFKKPKIYILVMFPYVSGEGLHVGHVENYTGADIVARYYRMKGFNVLHPMGWDAFGLPTENYAIKTKQNPMNFVPKNIEKFKNQIKRLGISYDWSREINTTDPKYYKWTQWMFLQFLKLDLAYEKEAPVNFCPSCKTGLSNEEVIEGKCERCGSETEIKNLLQWHLRITKYADRLLDDLKEVDWPEGIKEMQRKWIGKKEGLEIDFQVENKNFSIRVFTTRPETIFGCTFIAISPEHPVALKLATSEYYFFVEKYIKSSLSGEEVNEKTGVFTGSYAIHPITKTRIPIWITNYIVADYGTGAIMGVPAHDKRDFEFAKKFSLPIIKVINTNLPLPYEGEEGKMIDSEFLTYLSVKDAREKITEYLIKQGIAQVKINYKLRDWIFSRQRYWGEPIPIIKCPYCGNVPVPEEDLPVTLPKVKYYEPTGTGESPLAKILDWVNTKCPRCGAPSKRETNTMPQWAGSCWYYLRYLDPKNNERFADPKLIKFWMPVDYYIGGAEHAVLHLLYARFWHKVLYDLKLVNTKEPFYRLVNQGIILGPDNEKMSKSRGNIVNPEEVIKNYSADTLRVYEMFMGPFESTKPWSHEGINGIFRFLNRIYSLFKEYKKVKNKKLLKIEELEKLESRTIFKVTNDIEKFKFNTAISALMEYQRELSRRFSLGQLFSKKYMETLAKLLFPFAPHLAQECWSLIGKKEFLDKVKWPEYNKKYLKEKEVVYLVQVDGKLKDKMKIKEDATQQEVIEAAKKLQKVEKFLSKVKKIVFVKNKIVNFVTK